MGTLALERLLLTLTLLWSVAVIQAFTPQIISSLPTRLSSSTGPSSSERPAEELLEELKQRVAQLEASLVSSSSTGPETKPNTSPAVHEEWNPYDRKKQFEENLSETASDSKASENPLHVQDQRPGLTLEEEPCDTIQDAPNLSEAPPLDSLQPADQESRRKDRDTTTLQTMSLSEIIQALDQHSIRYPPSATRDELERLVAARKESTVSNQSRAASDASLLDSSARPLAAILKELDEYQIRYSPLSSRSELEKLLSEKREFTASETSNASLTTKLSLAAMLQQLDQHEIRYPPSASRAELEALLEGISAQKDVSVGPDETATPSFADVGLGEPTTLSLDSARRRQRRRQQHAKRASTWSKVLDKTTSSLYSGVDRAARKVRRVSRQAADLWAVDPESGVRDVAFMYSKQDNRRYEEEKQQNEESRVVVPEVIPVVDKSYRQGLTRQVEFIQDDASIPSKDHETSPPPRQRRRKASGTSRRKRVDASYFESEQHEEDLEGYRGIRRDKATQGANGDRPRAEEFDVYQTDTPSLLFAEPTRRTRKGRYPSSRRSRYGPERTRRVYSPYTQARPRKSDNEEMDLSLNRVGDMFVEAADRFMLGDEGSDETDNVNPEFRHWKDRLEERFDRAFGLPTDGSPYNRWTNEMNQQTGSSRPSGARRRGSSGTRRSFSKAFWEEDGSVLALLFGRSKKGTRFFDGDMLDPSSSILLNTVRITFRSSLLAAGFVCQWASVGGAVPQPLVVLGTLSAGLCARSHRRVRAMVIALVVLRVMGEMIHGYVHGSASGWDDEQWTDDDDNNEKDEDLADTSDAADTKADEVES